MPYNALYDKGYTSIGTQFTSFTGTKVQILTLPPAGDTHSTVKVEAEEEGERGGRFKGENRRCSLLALLVQKYLLTGTKVQILTTEE